MTASLFSLAQSFRLSALALSVLLLAVLTGCHYPPGRFAGCCLESRPQNPKIVLVRQIAPDTAVEMVERPLQAAATFADGTCSYAAAAAHGLVGKQIGLRLHGTPPPLCPCPTQAAGPLLTGPLQPACFQLYTDGQEGLTALEKTIDSATRQIDVLIYNWDDDSVGRCIASHLAARASAQVRVRILVDGASNLIFGPPPGTADSAPNPEAADPVLTRSDKKGVTAADVNRVVCSLTSQPGVEIVRTRNPFGHYDHRKMVLVDGCLAWTGGRNFTLPAFFSRHDICFTLHGGPLVSELQQMFECYWREQGGPPGVCSSAPPPPSSNAGAYLVHSGPTEHSLQHAVLHAVDQAQSSVWVENPYLFDNQFICRLAAARRRGADVRVVLTIRSNSDSVNHASRVVANKLLAAGVRVYLYPTRLHTKAAMVDGCWAYLGTGNFDLLSFRRNHEMGFIIGSGPILEEVAGRLFLPDFCPDWELHQPLPLSASDRLYGMISGIFM